ncbi:CHAT domain-containing protein [Pantanalinema rosaneae CENA516]|uniref:CHAT domain-containing protein n=1 Tax=Pantanalinema rosaneae TaxID=1620701 RepID=UPI003D700F3E
MLPTVAWSQVPLHSSTLVNQTQVASSPAMPLEQGRELYRSGRFTEAAGVWQSAAQHYQAQGDRLNQALSLSYLSLTYQELNQWDAAQQAIQQSLTLLKTASPPADAILWAQVLNTQASLQLHLGQAAAALEQWQQAQKFYQQAGDTLGSVGSQINQAQALQSLGFYRRAKQLLENLNQTLTALPDSDVKVSGLRSLGLALQTIGDPDKSQQVFTQGWAIAQKLDAKPQFSSLLLGLGKTSADLSQPDAALAYFEQAEQVATNPGEHLQAQLAQFNLFLTYNKPELVTALAPQLLQQFRQLPPSRTTLYQAINFTAAINRLNQPAQLVPLTDLSALMAATVQSAQQIQDASAEAYALYQWGQLYQRTQQGTEARQLMQRSLNIARQRQAADITAQAAWRFGQLQAQAGNRTEAIAAYLEAIQALQALRTDLVAVNTDVQFSFRESVEPVYRELVALLLDGQPSQATLVQARELIESLQIAELDNFFREACLDKAQQIDQVDPTATVVYPIILPDRLAVILSTAGQPLRYYATPKSHAEIDQTLSDLLVALNPVSDSKVRDRLSRQVYDWLIRPAEADQALQHTKTLVFVLDGRLRNIPMAALYDGQHYLIEKYAIALSPGLQLMAARPLQQTGISAIVGGISQSHVGFSALPAVETEVQEITQTIPATKLLNQEFTSAALADRVKNHSANIVHLATHGQFSSRMEDTFLLTWDGKVSVKELSELLQNRGSAEGIELLVLSACDTATGDDRAVLGLAGLAVKSGARSTIAALWPVKDQAAALLMTRFYNQLQAKGTTKAEALRQAQLHLIQNTDFRDPFFWSTFVLVGNWL